MSIPNLDAYINAVKQKVPLGKYASRTAIASTFFSVIDLNGNPGAGVLAGTNTANGVVPTDVTAGYPLLTAFGGGAKGHLTRIQYQNSVASNIHLYDRIFHAGAYAFNANTALTAQPSYTGRLPGGTDYSNLEIWVEQVTAATGNQAVTVTYTKEDGTTGRSTGAVGIGAAPTVGRCWQLPLQAGDKGIQKIDNVLGTVATAGTFNVMVLRPLGMVRVPTANFSGVQGILETGMPEIFDTSALFMLVQPDSTATGLPYLNLEVANA